MNSSLTKFLHGSVMTNSRVYDVAATGASSAQRPVIREVNWLVEHFPDPAQQREYAREKCVEAVAARLDQLMEEAGLSQTDLAARLDKSASQVSRLLSGAHNMTLYSLGDVLWACGRELRSLDDIPLGIVEISVNDDEAWTKLNAGAFSRSEQIEGSAVTVQDSSTETSSAYPVFQTQ
jgi:transcriptional regulator with XRE-family HTH domain